MKKTFFAFFFVLTAFCLIGCEKNDESQLSKPTGLRVSQEGETLVLSWNEVKNANEYSLTKNGSFWQMTSSTTATDYDPEVGNNTYEVVAVNNHGESEPATISYNYHPSSGGGDGGGKEEKADFYIKHPWGTGTDDAWAWKAMTKESGNYVYSGAWGGVGANINSSANDNGATWFAASSISGANGVSLGTIVKFIYNPSTSTLSLEGGSQGGGGQQETVAYYIKHPWGGGDWDWKPMTKSGNNYTYTGVWGGMGANINTSASDSGAEWYEKSKISGAASVSEGETVTFTFISSNGAVGSLSVSGNGGSNPGGGGGGGSTSKPSTPSDVSATATASSCIKVSWNSVSGADSYNVYRATSATGTYNPIDNTTSTYYTDCSVTVGTTYYYKVTAKNNAGESGQSAYTFAKVSSGGGGGGGGGSTNYEPCPPSVSCSGTSSVTVKWTASTSSGCGKPTSYNVARKNPITGKFDYVKEGTTSTSYTDSKPFPGINWYGVQAKNDYGTSGAQYATSSAISIAAPNILSISGSKNELIVSVKDLDVPEEWKQYYILEMYWKTSSTGSFTPQKTWKYNEFSSGINDKMTYDLNFGSSVDFSGKTFYYKFRWVFEAPNSPSKVDGSWSVEKTVKH